MVVSLQDDIKILKITKETNSVEWNTHTHRHIHTDTHTDTHIHTHRHTHTQFYIYRFYFLFSQNVFATKMLDLSDI